MQNNSKVNTVLLVVLIILVAIGVYFLVQKKEVKIDEMGTISEQIPNGQTQTSQNPNGADYQPNQTNSSMALFSQNGYSFMYNSKAQLKSDSYPTPGMFYSELSNGGVHNTIRLYPGALPSNFRPEFYTGTTVVNGKTFYYGDVAVEGGGVVRSYMYKKDGKTIVIDNGDLIDLGSVEINSNQQTGCATGYDQTAESKVASEKSPTLITWFEKKCDGNWYFTFDYLGPGQGDPESGNGSYYTNTNLKLRTFKMSPNINVNLSTETATLPLNTYVKYLVKNSTESFNQKNTYSRYSPGVTQNDYSASSVYEITVTNGVVIKMDEVYLP